MYVVVGAGGIAGRGILAALRARHPDAHVLATTSQAARHVPLATDVVTHVDLAQEGGEAGLRRLMERVGTASVDTLFFTPALGPVGFHVRESTLEQIAAASAFSLDPLLRLADRMQPRLVVGLSAFYNLPSSLRVYGAMGHVKREMDGLAAASPERMKMIRPGVFESPSAKAVALCVWREMKRGRHAELAEQWRAWGARFYDFFYGTAWADEAEAFGPAFGTAHRATTGADIGRAAALILEGTPAPFVNVIGDWLWESDAPPVAGAALPSTP